MNSSSYGQPILWSVRQARNFTLTLFVIMVGIKTALIVSEPAIALKPLEWFLIWPAMSFQHVIMASLIFGLYLGLFYLSTKNRPLRYGALGLVGVLQAVLPFLYISSLRVAHIIGGFTTFEMTEADSEGAVFIHELLDKGNLPYTVSGGILSVAAVLIPWLLRRRRGFWPKRLTTKITVMVLGCWLGIGMLSEHFISSYISVAAEDPVIYYFADMVEKKILNEWLPQTDVESSYPREPLFGDRAIQKTRKAFSGLEAWRKTNKNVILVVMESFPAAQSSFMGSVKTVKGETRDTTPNIRNLMKNGLLLKNHYSVHPTSMNSLFSINCSLYPDPGGGTITNINPKIPCHSISEILSKKGYKAALFHSGKFSFWNKLKFFRNRGYSLMQDSKTIPGHKSAHRFAWGIDEMVTAKAVVKYIEKNKDRPFFIQYIPVFPHAPYDAPPGKHAIFPNDKDINKYHNTVRYADSAMQIIIKGLKKQKLFDDTLLIFVGDHGEAFYEHPGNRVHSIYAYEENVHVAAAMSNPLLFPKGRVTIDRITSHIDLLPTIADLVGAPQSPIWHGYSLLKDRTSPLAYFYANWGPKILGMRDGRYKVMWETNKNTYEIYDIEKDPREKKNLKDKLKNRLGTYRESLQKWKSYHIKTIANVGKDKTKN